MFHEQLKYSEEGCNTIECLYSLPEGEGPFPVIFMLHFYQPEQPAPGAHVMYDLEYIAHFLQEGIATVSISQPGFGRTDGQRDFAGPLSRKIVRFVVDEFKSKDFIDENKIGLYAISQGAILSSMLSTESDDIIFQVLDGGIYDLYYSVNNMPEYMKDLRETIEQQAGDNFEEYCRERSVIYHTETIKADTLILHGQLDTFKSVLAAQQLHDSLNNSQLIVYPHTGHDIVQEEKWDDIIPFVRERFFSLYGIGKVTFSRAIPMSLVLNIQETIDIFQGELREGDSLISISPENDKTEITLSDVGDGELTKLILGRAGTKLRFYVLHSDGLYENVIIRRKTRW
jgi:dipeptidyl aminopeptidase/acylaminoacyl peptidase